MSKQTVTFWATEQQLNRVRQYGDVREVVGSHYRYEQPVREYQMVVDEIYSAEEVLKIAERPLTLWERLFG